MDARFEQFIQEKKYLANVSPATVQWYRASLKWLPTPTPDEAALKDLVVRMRTQGLRATSVNCHARAVNSYLAWAAIPLKVRRLKEEARIPPTFSPADIQKMVRWKPRGFCQTRLHCLVLMLADTGARIGEAIGLGWPDVDLDNLLLRLHGKGAKDRLVPFSLELRRHLWKWRKLNHHGIVFPTAQGGPIAHRNTLRDVRELCGRLGIEAPTRLLHAFRHSYRVAQSDTNIFSAHSPTDQQAISDELCWSRMMRSTISPMLFAVAVWVLSCSTAIRVVAQSAPTRSLLALSKRNHTLAIVDPNTLQVVARVPVGPDPHEVIASSDGKTAYVSIYGGGRYHALSVIDLVGHKALPDIDTGALNGPHGLAFAGGKVWFTAEGAKAVATYDPVSAKIDWIMGTGQNRTHMLYVTPDEKQIYTTNVSSATVSILEKVTLPPMGPPPGIQSPRGSLPPPGGTQPRMDWNETVIPVGKGDEGFDVSPDGRELWTANAQDGTLSVVDLMTRTVTHTLDAKTFGANRLKFTPNGKLVLISSLRDGDLVIYDAASRKQFKRVKIGHGAAGILVDRDGNRAFVACGPDNYVVVLDLKTLEVTGHVDVGGEPDGLAWAIRP